MTFLELTQELCDRANIPRDQLTTVTGLSGELNVATNWIVQAYIDIQRSYFGRWRYLHTEFLRNTRAATLLDAAPAVDAGGGLVTIPVTGHAYSASDYITIRGTGNYDGTYLIASVVAATSINITTTYVSETFAGTERAFVRDYEFRTANAIKSFDEGSLMFYRKSDGANESQPLFFLDYEEFKKKSVDYSSPDQPAYITITPSDKLRCHPAPDAVYTIEADAFIIPETLSVDSDVPLLPSEFHMLIVWKALIDYAGFEEAAPVLTYAKARHDELYSDLLWQQKFDNKQMVVRAE